MMVQSWHDIEQRLGIRDAESFARDTVKPHFCNIVAEPPATNGTPDNLQLPIGVAFAMFIVAFMGVGGILPENFIGDALRFILFPIVFLGALAASLFIFKDRFWSLFTRGQERFIARSKALAAIADEIGLTYVPSPGGAPKLLKFIVKSGLSPQALREAAAVLDDHGGMDEPLAIAQKSGAMVSEVMVLANDQQKNKYLEQQASYQQVEDGFEGTRDGVPFSAFEWVERVEDAPNIYHLALVFSAPSRLYSLTHLRSRNAQWPSAPTDKTLYKVSLGSSQFDERFRLRSTDQVEARVIFDPAVMERVIQLAHGEKVRAVAFENHLVFDVAGEDRFALVDLTTGDWSEETIRTTFVNIAEMLDLADAVAHTFNLRGAGLGCDARQ